MSSPVVSWRHTKRLTEYLGKEGTLIVWTKIHAAPEGFEEFVPFFSGIVEFGKERLPVMIVDCEEIELKIGMKVKAVVRKGAHVGDTEIIDYVIKVKPV